MLDIAELHKKILQIIAVRALLFNPNNQLLTVSRNGTKWSAPGGWIEKLEPAKQACVREIEEETGLILEVEKIIFIEESVVDDLDEYGNILHRFDLFAICTSQNYNLDPNWVDEDRGSIKHRKYITQEEWQTNPQIKAPANLKKLTFAEIKAMPNCYSWRSGVPEKYQHLLENEQ